MSKGLEALEMMGSTVDVMCSTEYNEAKKIVEKELKALEVIKDNFRLVGNCLHAKNPYAEDGWIFVKEIEDGEELDAWKVALE